MTLFDHPGLAIAAAFRALRDRIIGQPRHLKRANEEITPLIQTKLSETKQAADTFKCAARAGIRQSAQARRAACQVIKRLEAARDKPNDGP